MNATQHQSISLPINHPVRVAARTLDEIRSFLQLFYDFERYKCESNADAVWDTEFPDCDENVWWRHMDRLEAIDNVSQAFSELYVICDAGTMLGHDVNRLEESLALRDFDFVYYCPKIAEDLFEFEEESPITSHAKSAQIIREHAEEATDRLDAFIKATPGLIVFEWWPRMDQQEYRRTLRLHEFPVDGIAAEHCEPFLLTLEAICGFLDVFQDFEQWRVQFNWERQRLAQFPPRWATAAYHHEFMKSLELTIRALETLYLAVCPATTGSPNDLRANYAGLVSAYTEYFKQLSSDIAEFPHAPCAEDSSLSAASGAMRTLREIWTSERWTQEPGTTVAQSWTKRKHGYWRRSFTGEVSSARTAESTTS